MTNKHRSLMLMGRNEGGKSLVLQSHIGISEGNKCSIACQHPKPDANEGFYMFEYNKKFDRLDTTFKISTNETAVSATTAIYPNIFLGFESGYSSQMGSLIYSYGLYARPHPKFAFAATYIAMISQFGLDFSYTHNKYFKLFCNLSKSNNPMVVMQGGGSEITTNIISEINKEIEVNFEIDWLKGMLGAYGTMQLNRNVALQLSVGINAWNKQNKKILKNFGIGIKYETSGQESLMEIEEDISEYEYDKL